jgi:hypothetical protein
LCGLLCTTGISGQEFMNLAQDTLQLEKIAGNTPEKSDVPLKIARNYLVFTFGFIEIINAGYERNIFWKRGAQTNIRISYGFLNDLQGGAHEYAGTLVQLLGKRNSHLELNLGLAITQNVKNNMNPTSISHWPITYVGYRFEKPDGNFIFRTGFIYPTIYAIEVGVGIKF